MDCYEDPPATPIGFDFFRFDDIPPESDIPRTTAHERDDEIAELTSSCLTYSQLMNLDFNETIQSRSPIKTTSHTETLQNNCDPIITNLSCQNNTRPLKGTANKGNNEKGRSLQAIAAFKYRRRLKYQSIVLSSMFRFTHLTSRKSQKTSQQDLRRCAPEIVDIIYLDDRKRKRLNADYVIHCLEIIKTLSETIMK